MYPKRILYLLGWFAKGGIEAYILNVLDHIDKQKYIVDIAIAQDGTFGLEKTLIDNGHRVIYLSAKGMREQIREIRGVLQNGQYHIIHIMQGYLALEAHTVYGLACLLDRKRLGYKIINHSHSVEDLTKKTSFPKQIVRSALRGFLRFGFGRADALAACSQEAGEFMYGKKANVQVHLNGIDIARFQIDRASKNIPAWREKYGIHESNVNFSLVARISDEKNPIFLLRVIQCLRAYFPNLHFMWAGDGPQREEVIQFIDSNHLEECVHLLGTQHHVEEILACCDYFLFPSKREGAGIAIVEAQAAGLKCFASDRVPTLIDCGGVTFLALDKTPDQWAKEIYNTIIENPKPNTDAEILNRFSIYKTVAALCNLYDDLTN
jgi:glycosyltransferase involved in cell wall biosynthesis